MNNTRNFILAGIVLALSFSLASAQAATTPAPRPEPDFVTEKGFKSKVFDVKYREAESVAKVLRQLGSGFKGATISANSEFRTLTVRDFPENIATMEEALKRLDTPASPAPNIELHMHVLVATDKAEYVAPASAEIPAELKDVVAQLRQTLKYRNYELATSVVQRLTETPRGLRGKGVAEISRSPAPGGGLALPYEYWINNVTLAASANGSQVIQIGEFSFSTGLTQGAPLDNRTQIQTALNLRSGEKVVVGTATLGDRALIIVLTAKVLS